MHPARETQKQNRFPFRRLVMLASVSALVFSAGAVTLTREAAAQFRDDRIRMQPMAAPSAKTPGTRSGGGRGGYASKPPSGGPPVGGRPSGRPPMGGGGGRGPDWGGVAGGIAAGVIGGLILQGIANANTAPPPPPDYGYAPPPRNPGPRQQPSRAASNGGRGSGVPPVGETRLVPDEVVVEIPNSMPAQALAGVERRYRLSRVEFRRSTLSGSTLVRWRIVDSRSVPSVIRTLEREGMVGSAQPNYVYALQREASNEAESETEAGVVTEAETDADTPKAPWIEQKSAAPEQYALAKLNLSQAHELARGEDVLVAVIDSGIDGSHPDLQGAIADSFNAAASAPDSHAHGTGIAGLIAARGRVTGTAPRARILAVRAFDPKDSAAEATTFAILKGLDWSVEKRARVINMSFAGPADPAIARALAAAAKKGAVLIAAAGNAGEGSPPLYPAADPNVIAVTATGPDDTLFDRSNRGRHIAVAAPGVDIVAPSVEGGYQVASGTSMSAAEVSGIAALLLERKPRLTASAIRGILMSTARDLGVPGRDDQFGAGLADAYQAVMTVEPKTARSLPASASR